MPTCGYLCPKCEGKGFTDEGETCDWCTVELAVKKKDDTISDEEWQRSVHEGSCCAGETEKESDQSTVDSNQQNKKGDQ